LCVTREVSTCGAYGGGGRKHRNRRPIEAAIAVIVEGHSRPIELVVEVIFWVDFSERNKIELLSQSAHSTTGSFAGIIPAFESNDEQTTAREFFRVWHSNP